MRSLPTNLGQPARIKSLASQLDESIRSALCGPSAFTGELRGHQRIECGLERGSSLRVKHAVDPKHAIHHLAQMEGPPVVSLIRILQDTIRVDAMTEVASNDPQPRRIKPASPVHKIGFGFRSSLGSDLLSGAGEDGGMVVADLAVLQGLLGDGQGGEMASDLGPLESVARGQPALPAQPLDQADGAVPD